MTLHDNILECLRAECLTADQIAAKLMLEVKPVLDAIAELKRTGRIRVRGYVRVRKPGSRMTHSVDLLALKVETKRCRVTERMARERREFFGE